MNLCDRTQELISGYIDHELNQQDRQRVRVHLESCDRYQDISEICTEIPFLAIHTVGRIASVLRRKVCFSSGLA